MSETLQARAHTTVLDVFDVDLQALKEEFDQEWAEWQVFHPGAHVAQWVREVFMATGGIVEGEGFAYNEGQSTRDEEWEVK